MAATTTITAPGAAANSVRRKPTVPARRPAIRTGSDPISTAIAPTPAVTVFGPRKPVDNSMRTAATAHAVVSAATATRSELGTRKLLRSDTIHRRYHATSGRRASAIPSATASTRSAWSSSQVWSSPGQR